MIRYEVLNFFAKLEIIFGFSKNNCKFATSTSYHNKAICRRILILRPRVLRGDLFLGGFVGFEDVEAVAIHTLHV
jgi:hypothetical protein